ncbi:sugar phosphate isomerase/epimerase [Stieleria sp. TO1_6]|uniref:sugar phosphate isomerase/epimerase family protein n=1 Tax=Stieleria tagensis TaxID=2956795 RepID=UPI00209B3FA0|nr:sugar phosphate isomerase/epimerase family protein [Stieleria tagensis]MCO8125061.1 sugar phosphate isomerase/epimerase [Stieleria tagensis]
MTHRRDFLMTAAAATTAALAVTKTAPAATAAESDPQTLPVRFSLNTSTIRGQNLTIQKQIEVAAAAGYDGIEPWMRDIETYLKQGGTTGQLRQQIEDAGLFVASAIGFANWISDDEAERAAGLEAARHDMELVAQIGGKLIAAPPIGAHRGDSVSPPLEIVAQRYRTLCELGQSVGVYPQLELWGFSPTLSRLGELAYVATEANHEYACVLPDFYHIYKGGNEFTGLGMIEASKMKCFHINDYPGDPPATEIADKHRVFPGDGVCPLPQVIRGLLDNGFAGTFSLELFNPEYWKRDALEVAQEGLDKSKAVVRQALALQVG